MENRQDRERTRIRAARYVPGRGFAEGIDRTLNNLPRRECTPLRKKLLAASSIAAALLLLAFAAPPVVRAASELYQRLFGEVVEDIEAKQALPEEQKLAQLVEESERWWRGYPLEGASAEIGDVAVSVDYVRVMAADNFDEDAGGELDLTLTYSKIPSFDPSWVDFVLVVDGKEIPMRIDETVKTIAIKTSIR